MVYPVLIKILLAWPSINKWSVNLTGQKFEWQLKSFLSFYESIFLLLIVIRLQLYTIQTPLCICFEFPSTFILSITVLHECFDLFFQGFSDGLLERSQ